MMVTTEFKTRDRPTMGFSFQSLRFVFNCSSKLDCKEQNGYTTTNIKPDIGAVGSGVGGWGGPGSAPVRPSVCTPDMTRYTPSSVDQVARDRAWMNTCSSLSAAAQELSQHHTEIS